MITKLLSAVAGAAILAGSAYAAEPIPSAVYTFVCRNSSSPGSGVCPEGGRPGWLLRGSDGNFYGTAQVSSEGSSQPDGGTVFSLTPAGAFTVLHRFAPGSQKNYPGGQNPGPLTEGSDGNLYGTTLAGGAFGSGVIYVVSKQGLNFRVVTSFCSSNGCGSNYPAGAFVLAPDGNLYSTTAFGRTGSCYGGCGTIVRITAAGQYEAVHRFNGTTDGAYPRA
jgi:uncharacterized repeat protein (TIGR03803 family)